jgi:hypothetical protein
MSENLSKLKPVKMVQKEEIVDKLVMFLGKIRDDYNRILPVV